MEREYAEDVLEETPIEYPVMAGELITMLHDADHEGWLVPLLARLRPDYVFESEDQVIDLIEAPEYLETGWTDPNTAGHTLNYDQLDEEAS